MHQHVWVGVGVDGAALTAEASHTRAEQRERLSQMCLTTLHLLHDGAMLMSGGEIVGLPALKYSHVVI